MNFRLRGVPFPVMETYSGREAYSGRKAYTTTYKGKRGVSETGDKQNKEKKRNKQNK